MRNQSSENLLLATAATDGVALLHDSLELVSLPLGRVLHDTGDSLSFAYFPSDAIVSLMQVQADGAAVEIAMAGKEGMIDAALLLGRETAFCRAQVLSAGHGYRVPVAVLRELLAKSPALRQHASAYLQALLMQVAQTALCNRHHRLDQQLCRWLLQNMDRLALSSLTSLAQPPLANGCSRSRPSIRPSLLKSTILPDP